MFIRSDGKDLSIHQLSTIVCRLILHGDPVHDIRKFAASLSFIQCMDVKELLKSIAWKSPAAFFRHYLIPTSRPLITVAIPGVSITSAYPLGIPSLMLSLPTLTINSEHLSCTFMTFYVYVLYVTNFTHKVFSRRFALLLNRRGFVLFSKFLVYIA